MLCCASSVFSRFDPDTVVVDPTESAILLRTVLGFSNPYFVVRTVGAAVGQPSAPTATTIVHAALPSSAVCPVCRRVVHCQVMVTEVVSSVASVPRCVSA